MQLTHVDAHGAAHMVDVAGKDATTRRAQAQGRFVTTAEVIGLLRRDGLPKGDALAVARIAGIMGAKRTSELIPLCHPVALHGVTVDLDLGDEAVTITATTRTADRTGVEMEALTAVAAAGLTLYDMVKAVDRGAVLSEIRLLTKDGGRTGEWHRAHKPGTGADGSIAGSDELGTGFDGPGTDADRLGVGGALSAVPTGGPDTVPTGGALDTVPTGGAAEAVSP